MTAGETRVLLVEDDPAVRSALLGALEDAGFEALGASDAAEALGVLAQHRVTVVVADYHLPGVVGLGEARLGGAADRGYRSGDRGRP